MSAAPGEHDAYLDRGMAAVPSAEFADTSSAHVVIADGTELALSAMGKPVLMTAAAPAPTPSRPLQVWAEAIGDVERGEDAEREARAPELVAAGFEDPEIQ